MWDIHVHLIPPDVIEAAEHGHFGLRRDGDWIIVDGKRVLAGPRMTDGSGVLHYARDFGLACVLSVPPALVRYGAGPKWASFLNDSLYTVARGVPDAEMLAVMPLEDPAQSAHEWERIHSKFLGITVTGSVGKRLLSDAAHAVFWLAMDTTGGLVFVHGDDHDDPRLTSFYLNNLLGYPYEDTLAAADLVFSGLPVRFPGIQWCISHGGGAAPYLLARWQRGYDTGRPGIDRSNPSPRDVYRELWFDSVVHDGATMEFLMASAPGRVVFGTDYPFPMGTAWQLEDHRIPEATWAVLQKNTERLMATVKKGLMNR